MFKPLFPIVTLLVTFLLALSGCASPPAEESAPAESATAEPAATETPAVGLEVRNATANLMPGMGAVYLTVVNPGTETDRLVMVETEAAQAAETHETVEENGMMKMVPHLDGFEVPAGGELVLEPGGKHIMLVEPLELGEGAALPLTLHFENAGTVELEITVQAMSGEMDHGEMDHGEMDHGEMDHGEMDHDGMDHGETEHGGEHGESGHEGP